jgi:hypothetical protein
MSQIVIGSTLGFVLAQCLLQGVKLVFVSARREEMRQRLRTAFSLRESGLADGFVKYAGAVALVAALTVLGGWSLADYLEAKSSAAATKDTEVAQGAAESLPAPARPEANGLDAGAAADPVADRDYANESAVDPYSDSEFSVRRRARRGASDLKDAFLQRSEEKARSDLLKQTQEREQRSQYDCEVAAHAARYIKAGLDVWGFATWQAKYFPLDGYKGATLPECKSIRDVIDPKRINVKSAVANRSNM